MRTEYFALVTVFFLMGCNQSDITLPGEGGALEQKVSALVASNGVDFVDVRVEKFYRYKSSRPDHMSSRGAVIKSGYASQGVFWYILPFDSPYAGIDIFGTSKNGDYMTSKVKCTIGGTGEAGYKCDEKYGMILGLNDPSIGLLPLRRFYSTGSVLDHLDAAYAESPSNYVNEGVMGYAWSTKSQQRGTSTIAMETVTKDGIKIGTSYAWGGSIVSLSKNAFEYVNRCDAGREIQTALHYYVSNAQEHFDNPTEAGDLHDNGSPIINYDINFNGEAGRIRTQSMAVRWGEKDDLVGTSPDSPPILSGTAIGKDAKIINATRVQYNSWIKYGKNFTAPAGVIDVINEEVVTYLVNKFDQLKIFEWNSAQNRFLERKALGGHVDTGSWVEVEHTITKSGYAIAYTNNGNNAFAIFKKNPSGNIALALTTSKSKLPDNLPYSMPTVRLGVYNRVRSTVKGVQANYLNYLLVGTKAEVETEAKWLATH